ncbi:MAG: ubiquitin-like domain-containing protein, partial [Myxococcota bacterium]
DRKTGVADSAVSKALSAQNIVQHKGLLPKDQKLANKETHDVVDNSWQKPKAGLNAAPGLPSGLQVFISTPNGGTATESISPNMKVADFKAKLAAKLGLNPDDVYLVHNSKPLKETADMKDYNIHRNSTLMLNGRIRGGSGPADDGEALAEQIMAEADDVRTTSGQQVAALRAEFRHINDFLQQLPRVSSARRAEGIRNFNAFLMLNANADRIADQTQDLTAPDLELFMKALAEKMGVGEIIPHSEIARHAGNREKIIETLQLGIKGMRTLEEQPTDKHAEKTKIIAERLLLHDKSYIRGAASYFHSIPEIRDLNRGRTEKNTEALEALRELRRNSTPPSRYDHDDAGSRSAHFDFVDQDIAAALFQRNLVDGDTGPLAYEAQILAVFPELAVNVPQTGRTVLRTVTDPKFKL